MLVLASVLSTVSCQGSTEATVRCDVGVEVKARIDASAESVFMSTSRQLAQSTGFAADRPSGIVPEGETSRLFGSCLSMVLIGQSHEPSLAGRLRLSLLSEEGDARIALRSDSFIQQAQLLKLKYPDDISISDVALPAASDPSVGVCLKRSVTSGCEWKLVTWEVMRCGVAFAEVDTSTGRFEDASALLASLIDIAVTALPDSCDAGD